MHTSRQESTSPLHTVRNDPQLLSDGPIHQLIEAALMHFSDMALVKPHWEKREHALISGTFKASSCTDNNFQCQSRPTNLFLMKMQHHREICLLLLGTTEVNPYLGQDDTRRTHPFLLLPNTALFLGISFCFNHLALLNRPVIFELQCFTFRS